MAVFLGFRCSVTFVNNVICACREQFPPLSLLEHLPFEAPFFLSSEDQETRKRISLNSFHCPCEEYSWRKCDELCDVRARAHLLRNALSSSSASTEHWTFYVSWSPNSSCHLLTESVGTYRIVKLFNLQPNMNFNNPLLTYAISLALMRIIMEIFNTSL